MSDDPEWVSDCCGEELDLDSGICLQCYEHCEAIDLNEEDDDN